MVAISAVCDDFGGLVSQCDARVFDGWGDVGAVFCGDFLL